jgi:hypothetical protein
MHTHCNIQLWQPSSQAIDEEVETSDEKENILCALQVYKEWRNFSLPFARFALVVPVLN